MNPSAIRIAKYLFGYLGINITVDTYRRFSQLVAARNHADSLERSMLNINCGKTDFGDINADIIDRNVQNFLLYDPNRPLPFVDKYFGSVYSSHALERVKDPVFFLNELERVADKVFLVLPDIWMISAFQPSNSVVALNQTGRRLVKNPLHSLNHGHTPRLNISGDVILPLLYKLKTRSERFFKKHQSVALPSGEISDGSLAHLPPTNNGIMIEYGGAGSAYESLNDDARLQQGESLARIRKNEKTYGLEKAIEIEMEYLQTQQSSREIKKPVKEITTTSQHIVRLVDPKREKVLLSLKYDLLKKDENKLKGALTMSCTETLQVRGLEANHTSSMIPFIDSRMIWYPQLKLYQITFIDETGATIGSAVFFAYWKRYRKKNGVHEEEFGVAPTSMKHDFLQYSDISTILNN